jgi:DNA-binding FrmR family transcriptional regulator
MAAFTSEQKKKAITSLKKVSGLMEKLEHMLGHDADCPEIAQQINAAIGLLKSLNMNVLKFHLLTAGPKQMNDKNKKREKFVEELVKMWDVSQRK